MQIYRTGLAKNSQVPSQLEFLQVAYRRNLLQSSKHLRLYRNLEIGDRGEQFVIDTLKKYGCQHWIVLKNLWLDHFGVYENDIILITNHAIYVFEVKNYEGKFEYKNSRCFMNGRKLKENSIQQAEKAWMNLQEICGLIDHSINVKGALLFVGEHNEVAIQSDVDGIEIITRNTLRKYMQAIKQEEELYPYHPLNVQRILNHFEKREVLNPFGPLKSYTPNKVFAGKVGISCKECGSYTVELTRKFVRCEQMHEELRRDAVLRTIEEFQVLTFETDYVTRSELNRFLNDQVSEPYLTKFLNRHFVRIHNGRYSKYQIK